MNTRSQEIPHSTGIQYKHHGSIESFPHSFGNPTYKQWFAVLHSIGQRGKQTEANIENKSPFHGVQAML